MNASWSRSIRPLLCGTLLLFAVGGCGDRAVAPESAPSAPDARAGDPADRPPVYVTTAPVEQRTVRRTVAIVGSLHGFEKAVLAPKVEGRVAAWHFDVGDRVPPGAVLLEIDPTDYELSVEEARRGLEQELARLGVDQPPDQKFDLEALPGVARAVLLLDNSKKRFERQRALVEGRAAAKEAFELAETELRVAESSLKQARMDARWSLAAVRHRQAVLAQALQRLQDCRLAAPSLPPVEELKDRDYVVARRMAAVGEVVRAVPATPVYELVVDSVLKLRAMVPERAMGAIRPGQLVELQVDAYPDRKFEARVGRVNPTIDQRSRTFEIEAIVPNDDHALKPGGFAKAQIVVSEQAAALTVPNEAIVSLAGVTKVFVLAGDRVRETPVEIESRDSLGLEVRGALQPGDPVVTSGQSQLFDGARAVLREATP